MASLVPASTAPSTPLIIPHGTTPFKSPIPLTPTNNNQIDFAVHAHQPPIIRPNQATSLATSAASNSTWGSDRRLPPFPTTASCLNTPRNDSFLTEKSLRAGGLNPRPTTSQSTLLSLIHGTAAAVPSTSVDVAQVLQRVSDLTMEDCHIEEARNRTSFVLDSFGGSCRDAMELDAVCGNQENGVTVAPTTTRTEEDDVLMSFTPSTTPRRLGTSFASATGCISEYWTSPSFAPAVSTLLAIPCPPPPAPSLMSNTPPPTGPSASIHSSGPDATSWKNSQAPRWDCPRPNSRSTHLPPPIPSTPELCDRHGPSGANASSVRRWLPPQFSPPNRRSTINPLQHQIPWQASASPLETIVKIDSVCQPKSEGASTTTTPMMTTPTVSSANHPAALPMSTSTPQTPTVPRAPPPMPWMDTPPPPPASTSPEKPQPDNARVSAAVLQMRRPPLAHLNLGRTESNDGGDHSHFFLY